MRHSEYVAPGLLIATSLAGFVAFAYVAATRPLTDLESVLLQVLAVSTGFTGTFMVGRLSATTAAKGIIEPHARSALRRLVSQYQSLHRMATIIESSHDSNKPDPCQQVLARLGEIAISQIRTADDAIADWEDVVPEDVKELRRVLSSRRPRRGRQ